MAAKPPHHSPHPSAAGLPEQLPIFIDIKDTNHNYLRFLFELATHPNSQPNCLIPGKYAVKVVLYSDNADKKEVFFQIAWSGEWKDKISEMFRELTINEIPLIE